MLLPHHMDFRRTGAILLVLLGALIVSDWEMTHAVGSASSSTGWPSSVWVGFGCVLVGAALTLARRGRRDAPAAR